MKYRYLPSQKLTSIKSFGMSMNPLFIDGDIVYLKKISFSKIEINDIVAFKKLDKFLIHRVIYKKDTDKFYLITKGDNNSTSDGKVYPHQIIGKVYQIKRGNKVINPEDLYLIQSSLYFAEIVKIKRALEKEKVDFVFLKGLPLHLYFVNTHPRRIYADCDVLISKSKLDKVTSIINNFGYKISNSSLSKLHDIFREKIIEIQFYKTINNFPVIFDIHLEIDWMSPQLGKLDVLYPQKLIDRFTDECFKTKISITVNNEKFIILNSEFLILYLALHFFHHNFQGVYRLEFLAKIISRYTPGRSNFVTPSRWTHGLLEGELWQKLSKEILDYRLQNFVYPVFFLLKKYYQTPLSSSFLEAMEQWNNGTMEQYLNINIFDDEPRIKAGVTRFKNLFFLSPNPWWRKLFIIFNPQVIYSVLWVIIKRLTQPKLK